MYLFIVAADDADDEKCMVMEVIKVMELWGRLMWSSGESVCDSNKKQTYDQIFERLVRKIIVDRIEINEKLK